MRLADIGCATAAITASMTIESQVRKRSPGTVAADAELFAAIWSTALVMPASLEAAPPATERPAEEVGMSALHHAVYTVVLGAFYRLFRR